MDRSVVSHINTLRRNMSECETMMIIRDEMLRMMTKFTDLRYTSGTRKGGIV
jgi:hypothetical protein